MHQNKTTHFSFYGKILFILTFISFLSIILFLMFFTAYAPGNYPLGSISHASHKSIMDIFFAILLFVNNIFVILSFVEFVKLCVRAGLKRQVVLKTVLSGIAFLYPIVIIFSLCNWRFSILAQYFFSPIQIIFGI